MNGFVVLFAAPHNSQGNVTGNGIVPFADKTSIVITLQHYSPEGGSMNNLGDPALNSWSYNLMVKTKK